MDLSRGFAFARAYEALSAPEINLLIASLESDDKRDAGDSACGGAVYARRSLETQESVRDVAALPRVRSLAEEAVGGDARLVRAILFDKRPGANWPVPWHQDLSLVVAARAELPGWGPWSVKAGMVHVQPPAEYLTRSIALRLHLDDCPQTNGALRVLPGTHRRGRLSATEIQAIRAEVPEVVCDACAGDILLIRPLLLHASSPSLRPERRRVLHLEFAPVNLLPPPLRWADAPHALD